MTYLDCLQGRSSSTAWTLLKVPTGLTRFVLGGPSNPETSASAQWWSIGMCASSRVTGRLPVAEILHVRQARLSGTPRLLYRFLFRWHIIAMPSSKEGRCLQLLESPAR